MDVCVILTYRCNSKCSMCHVWQNPTIPAHEVSLSTLSKIPPAVSYLNLSGGEPTLRSDLVQIVDLLYPKARTLEISTNGLHSDRLEAIVKKYPNVKIRISLEGTSETNARIRGESGGYEKKIAGLRRLQQLGGTDLGFATTIQDENANELVAMFQLAQENRAELATSALHNGFQFHKSDNVPYDRLQVAKQIELLLLAQLRSWSVKNWFRAYLNLGLIAKVLGQDRLLPCTAGTDFVFIDPFSDVYACNVRPDLKLGNLESQTWDEVWNGRSAQTVRNEVARCTQNCWMTASVKTAMRNPRFTQLPRFGPLMWVVANKVRATLGLRVPFEHYVDYARVHKDAVVPVRESFLGRATAKRVHEELEDHYDVFGDYVNR